MDIRDQIEQHIDKAKEDFVNVEQQDSDSKQLLISLRSAYRSIERARKLAEEHDIDYEDYGLTQDIRLKVRQDAQSYIDGMLRDTAHFDANEARQWLDLWQNVMGTVDALLEQYQRDVDKFEKRAYERVLVERIEAQVNQLWQEAKLLAESGAATDALLKLYTEARDIARESAASNPSIISLQQLAQEAEERRVTIAKEREEMLSGQQLGDYERQITYINQLPDDAQVPIYDKYGTLLYRRPKIQARQITIEQAKDFIDDKIQEYIVKATEELDAHRPRKAIAILHDANQFNSLRDNYIPDLYKEETQRTLRDTEREIEDAIHALELAEQNAEEALKTASNNVLAGYREFQNALLHYEGARDSEETKRIRNQLRTMMQANLDGFYDELFAEYSSENRQAWYEDNLLLDIDHKIQQTLQDFEVVKDVPLTDRLDKLKDLQVQVRQSQQEVEHIIESLNRIEQEARNNPEIAEASLKQLQREARRALLDMAPQYERVRTSVELRSDQNSLFEFLQSFLHNPNLAKVREGLIQAQKASSESIVMRTEFENLVSQLEATVAVLEADRIARDKSYDEAIRTLDMYRTLDVLEDGLRTRIERKYAELNDRARLIGDNQARMKTAKDYLHAKPPQAEDAYHLLREMRDFSNYEEQSEHRRLFEDARQELERQLVAWMRELKVEKEFTLSELRYKMDTLLEINSTRANQMKQQLHAVESVQIAREESNLADQIEQLKSALEVAGGQERVYIRKLIREKEFERFEQKKDDQLIALRRLTPGDESVTLRLAELNNLQDELRRSVRDTDERRLKIIYTTWLVEIAILRSQYAPDPKARTTAFDDMKLLASNLGLELQLAEGDPQAVEWQNDVKKATAQLDIAKLASDIEKAIRNVELNLTAEANFGVFNQAVQEWKKSVGQYPEIFAALSRWYKSISEGVQKELREKLTLIRQANDTPYNPDTLPVYAKLLLIDEKDEEGLLMVSSLPRLAGDLKKDVDNLHRDYFGINGYSPNAAENLLADQVRTLNKRLEYISLIREIVRYFSNVDTMREQSRTLNDTTADEEIRLKNMVEKLSSLQTRIKNFEGFLDGFDLVNDENQSWRRVRENFDDRWEEFIRSVEGIDTRLAEHPSINGLRAKLEASRARIESIVDQLMKIQNAVKDERYEVAYEIITGGDGKAGNQEPETTSRLSLARAIKRTTLYDTFDVYDALNKDRIVGWENVVDFVKRRHQALNKILTWARPFNLADDISGDISLIEPETIPISDNVVNWAKYKARHDELLGKGYFSEAVAIVEEALNGNPDKLMSLQVALNVTSRPPLATAIGEQTGSYNDALEASGGQRATRILLWMRRFRYEVYQAQVNEANQLISANAQKARDWDELRGRLVSIIGNLGELLEGKKTFFGRKIDKNAVQEEYERADRAIQEMRRISQYHEEINNYINHPTLIEARNLK